MTGAEYRTLREACGLSLRDAAAFHRVAERTIAHWETGRNAIPTGAADELRRLDASIARGVTEAVRTVDSLRATHGEPDTMTLTRYRTAQDYAASRAAREGLPHPAHNALLARTMTALEQLGAPVRIVWG